MIQRNPILDFFAPDPDRRGGDRVLPALRHLHRLHPDGEQIQTSNPISLLPGNNFIESYRFALFGGKTEAGASVAPIGRADDGSAWAAR
jgi:sn-glycerol 3-phosphate transport system permease protein